MRASDPSLVESRGPSFDPFGGPGKLQPLSLGAARPKTTPAPLPPVGGFGGIARPTLRSNNSVTVEREWTGVTCPDVWKVNPRDLELVSSLDFPLERTHREITGADAVEVASRISSALAALSIEAQYDGENARAKCRTGDCVCFRIRLYSGSESGQPVVVEMQRRNGSASVFMQSCRAILSAAEGKAPACASKKVPPFLKSPIRDMKCLQGVIISPRMKFGGMPLSPVEASNEALDRVMSMLRAKKRDDNLLALENLCCLTDPVKTSPQVALRVSRLIAIGDDEYDIRDELRDIMERDVFASPPEFGSAGFDDDDIPSLSHADHLRCLAFRALSNALEMCLKDGCLARAVADQRWFTEHLVPSLLDELKIASTSGSIAHEAASCLHSIVASSEEVGRRFVGGCHPFQGGIDVLRRANEFGNAQHALLAEETRRCLTVLGAMHRAA